MTDRGGTLQHLDQGKVPKRCPISVYAWPVEDTDRWNTRAPQTTEGQELHGPHGWLNGHRALGEENWELENDPFDNNEEYFSIPLYALTDPFKEIGKDAQALEPADTGTIQALAEKEGDGTLRALMDVINERYRQISVEGWTTEHDDSHRNGELAQAAAAYAFYCCDAENSGPDALTLFPKTWDKGWFKPTTDRRNLVKAAALLLADIERRDRAAKGGAA